MIKPFIVSAVGFIFTYFHLLSCGISVLLSVTAFLTWDGKVLVGSLSVVWKLFAHIKSVILQSYCFMGKIIKEPLFRCVLSCLHCP